MAGPPDEVGTGEDAGFLAAARTAPDDLTVRLVYADWLEERGDPRHLYLRAAGGLSAEPEREEANQAIRAELLEMADGLDHGWESAVARSYAITLVAYPDLRKIPVVRRVRDLTGLRLVGTVRLTNALPNKYPGRPLPRVILQGISADRARAALRLFGEIEGVEVAVHPALPAGPGV